MAAYQMDFSSPVHVHFIGIGGISMSGLAELLLREGFAVSGSDMQESSFTERLRALGARVFIGQRAENVADGADCAVYTAAIRPDNPEYRACGEQGIPLLSRAEFIGQLMRRYRHSVAVSGTHGKTSTTGMLSHILIRAEQDPTISIGGVLPLIGGNLRIGGNGTFLLEACEYTNSFLSFNPTLAVILNIEADHLDFFKDLDDIRNSFRLFVKRLPEDGTVVISREIRDYAEILDGFPGRVITFGPADADVTAEEIAYDELGHPSFVPVVFGERRDRVRLAVPGLHNVWNALAALAAAAAMGVSQETAAAGLASFGGAERRFEKKGELPAGAAEHVTVIDDYAHHPQEIEATLSAAEHFPHRTLWCVFQPHTYSRTKALLSEFAEALSKADRVILPDIYPARETDTLGVSSADIAERINRQHPGKALYLPSFEKVEEYLLQNACAGDLILTMGAGDVYRIGEALVGG